jgi:hypothetical protein
VEEREPLLVKKGNPYILTVANNTNETIKDFTVLSFLKQQNPICLDEEGNILIKKNQGEITIKSEIKNISHKDFLLNLIENIFNVSTTYIVCSNPEQIIKNFEVKQKDAIGNVSAIDFIPLLDIDVLQKKIIGIKYDYNIDCFTEINFTEILPNSRFTMYLYPISENTNKIFL